MATRGKRATIDLAELEKLCAMQCTDEEIAGWFDVTTRSIERYRQQEPYANVMARGKAKGRVSIRRMQMKLLEEGNATMGIWLGKQVLGQTDHVQHGFDGVTPVLVIMPGIEWSEDSDKGSFIDVTADQPVLAPPETDTD